MCVVIIQEFKTIRRHSVPIITAGMLRDADAGDHVCLTLKAWNIRVLLAYLDVCLLKQLQLDEAANREPHAEVLLAACATRELVYWFLEQEAADRRYLLPEQARSICNHGDEYLKYAEKLSIYASTHSILRWKVLPKMHAARPYNMVSHISCEQKVSICKFRSSSI